MNVPTSNGGNGQGGETPPEVVGEELRRFFVELLQEKNLQEYHEGRGDYVTRRRDANELSEEAENLLLNGTLAEIEEHVKLVTGSRHAYPIMVVFPPV